MVDRTIYAKTKAKIKQIEDQWLQEIGISSGPDSRLTQFSFVSSDKCALLIHGFNSCPGELDWVRLELNKMKWSTISLCLPGFTNAPLEANFVTEGMWLRAVSETFSVVRGQFPLNLMVGHSLGATLALYYQQANHANESFKSILLAPYLGSYKKMDSISLIILGYFFKSLNYRSLYAMSLNPDLISLIRKPEVYGTQFPLIAVKEVIRLGEKFDVNKSISHSKALVLYSECDRTVSKNRIDKLIQTNPSWTFKALDRHLQVNHQFKSPLQEAYPQIIESICTFITNECE